MMIFWLELPQPSAGGSRTAESDNLGVSQVPAAYQRQAFHVPVPIRAPRPPDGVLTVPPRSQLLRLVRIHRLPQNLEHECPAHHSPHHHRLGIVEDNDRVGE